jgi:hypothetical protein
VYYLADHPNKWIITNVPIFASPKISMYAREPRLWEDLPIRLLVARAGKDRGIEAKPAFVKCKSLESMFDFRTKGDVKVGVSQG